MVVVCVAIGFVLAAAGCVRSDGFERAVGVRPDHADALARMGDRPVQVSRDENPAVEVSPGDPAAAVVRVWERYLRSRFELASSSPSDDAIDIESYSIEDARQELLSIYRKVLFDGYVDGRTLIRESIEVRLLGPSSAQIESCVVETNAPYWDDGSLVEPEPLRRTAWARLVRVAEGKWSVAAVDFEGRRC